MVVHILRRLGMPCGPHLRFVRFDHEPPTGSLAKLCFSTTSANNQNKKRRRGGRHFAYRKNEERELEEERRKKQQHRKLLSTIRPPIAAPRTVPPALLAPTGSPYVFVSKPALTVDQLNAPDEALNQAQLLFPNYTTLPRLFETHQFDYVPPSTFNFELPSDGVPEVAFLGRSNVGKSSLVNALMRRDLCQTSKSPGRTQLPYYYGLFPKQLMTPGPSESLGYLVDLPGYGFGKAPKHAVEDWQAKTQDWLIDRRDAGVLKRLFLLFDSRREPSELDATVIQWTEDAQIPFTVCLTKSDRVGIPQVVRQVNDHCIRFATQETCQSPMVHVSSSSKKWGINEILEAIEAEFLGVTEEGMS